MNQRRHQPSDNDKPRTGTLGPWRVEPEQLRLCHGDTTMALEPKLMALLVALISAQGEAVSRGALMQAIWGHEHVTDDALNRLVARLRKFLRQSADQVATIETVPRVGYRLLAAEPHPLTPQRGTHRILGNLGILGPSLTIAAALLLAVAGFRLSSVATTMTPERELTLAQDWSQARMALVTSEPGLEIQPTLSPDGSHVAYVKRSPDGHEWGLYVRPIQGSSALLLTGTDEAGDPRQPVWSPDGQRLAYLQRRDGHCEVRTISTVGGPSQPLADCDPNHGDALTWSPDGGALVFHPPGQAGLVAMQLNPRFSRQLTRPPTGVVDSNPVFSPDGGSLAFVRWATPGVADLYLSPGEGGNARRLTREGHKLHGVTWDRDGEHLIFASNRLGGFHLWRIGLAEDSEPRRVPAAARVPDQPVLSGDGRRLLFQDWQVRTNLFRVDSRQPTPQPLRVSDSSRWDWNPAVSANGEQLAFISDRQHSIEVWLGTPGPGELETSAAVVVSDIGGPFTAHPDWHPDGNRLVYESTVEDQNFNLFVFDRRNGATRRLTDHPAADRYPHFTSNGEYLIFSSRRSGDWALWSMHLADRSVRRLTASDAVFGFQAADGTLYFSRAASPGIWRQTDGGEAQLLIDNPGLPDSSNWTLRGDVLWYVSRDTDYQALLNRYDLGTGESVEIGPLPRLMYKSGLSADRHGRVYFASVVDSQADLIMLER